MPAGRPTELDDELCLKIREFVLDGKTQKEIAKLCGLAEETIESWIWRNYKGFADRYRLYKNEHRLKKAEAFGDYLLNEEQRKDKEILKLKQKEAEFIRETLGKKDYSKRSELGGVEDKPIIVKTINYGDSAAVQVPAERLSDTAVESD